MAQVREHTESTTRQYGLAEEAVRLGWAREAVMVIDTDLGVSGRWGVPGDVADVAGVVFIWFGALEVANVTPVAALVARHGAWLDAAWFIPLLGAVEVLVGMAVIAGRRLTG